MRINISLDDELVAKIDEAARRMFVSRSSYIAFAVAQKMQADEAIANMPKFADALQGAVDIEQRRLASGGKK